MEHSMRGPSCVTYIVLIIKEELFTRERVRGMCKPRG
uniref:Uncharacterized protein n=1 Tax=Arundo donax TaxID=35708 RepID=A0A0A9E8N9_ARUDO